MRDYFFLQGTGKPEILFIGGRSQASPWDSPCYSRRLVQKNKLHHFIEDQKWLINPGKLIWCREIGLLKSCWSILLSFLIRLLMEPALAGVELNRLILEPHHRSWCDLAWHPTVCVVQARKYCMERACRPSAGCLLCEVSAEHSSFQ